MSAHGQAGVCCNCGEPPEKRARREPDLDGEYEPAIYYSGRQSCLCGHGCHSWSWDDVPGFRDDSQGPCCNGLCPCKPSPLYRQLKCTLPKALEWPAARSVAVT